MADEDVLGVERRKRLRRREAEQRVDADRLVAGGEVGNRPERVGDDQDASLGPPERGLAPEAVAHELNELERPDVTARNLVERHAVPARERGGVAAVPVEQLDHAGRHAEGADPVVETRVIDRVDKPDAAVREQCVRRPLERLLDLPAEAPVLPVDERDLHPAASVRVALRPVTYDVLRDLPLLVESYELDGLELAVSSEFTRKTTVIRLRGGGEEGAGEDVLYDAAAHDAQQAAGPELPLAGEHTLDSFSALLEGMPDLRRWGYESAALDLALRQAERSLAGALGLESRPVTYVVSTRATSLEPLLALYPGLRFKLDPTPDWTDEFVAALPRDRVDTVDLKGAYHGTPVDNPPDPGLYRRVAEAFPHAWIEDPALTPETEPVLAQHRDRITWDAPLHSVADIEALPLPPRTINVKPSRFGSVRELCAVYDHCAERGIAMYGGGQFELGPGRDHIQYLASLFHPDTPNDVAPSAFNEPEPRGGIPESPLRLAPAATGFRVDG